MCECFGKKLSSWISQSNLSRSEVIAKLQLFSFNDFCGTDHITLSRWLNGRTTPSLYKQILIAICLEQNVGQFLVMSDLHPSKLPIRIFNIKSKFEKTIDYLNPTLSYKNLDHIKCNIVEFKYFDFNRTFKDFYDNISSSIPILDILEKQKENFKNHTILLYNKYSEIIAHFPILEGLTYFPNITKKDLNNSFLINVVFFQTTNQYYELIIHASCLYLLNPYYLRQKRNVYILVHGLATYEITKSVFSAEDVKYPNSKNNHGIYMLKVDILKAITNPIIIRRIQKKLTCLLSGDEVKCNKCNRCNLREYKNKVSFTYQ